MEIWSFGSFIRANYQDEEQSAFVEVSPDAGIPYRRPTFTDVGELAQGTFLLTAEQKTYFKDFYKRTLKMGSQPFIFHDCRYNLDRVARIIGTPTYVNNDKYVNLNITLYLEPTSYYLDFNLLTEDGDDILTEDGDNILVSKEIQV